MWCSKSNWDGKNYDSTHTVTLKKYIDYDILLPAIDQKIDYDWNNCIVEKNVLNDSLKHQFLEHIKLGATYPNQKTIDFAVKEYATRKCPDLTPQIYEWLEQHVTPSTDKDRADNPMGWCIGHEQYRMNDAVAEFTIWFLRRRDAMKFIKRWSIHGKPTTFMNYFKDQKKKLIDGKLVEVDKF